MNIEQVLSFTNFFLSKIRLLLFRTEKTELHVCIASVHNKRTCRPYPGCSYFVNCYCNGPFKNYSACLVDHLYLLHRFIQKIMLVPNFHLNFEKTIPIFSVLLWYLTAVELSIYRSIKDDRRNSQAENQFTNV